MNIADSCALRPRRIERPLAYAVSAAELEVTVSDIDEISPMLSVVIPVRNGGDLLVQQVKCLLDEDCAFEWEILVSDNGSIDGTQDLVRELASRHSSVRLIDASSRAGAGHARNVGLEHARSDRIAFCDADDTIQPGWVTAMYTALASHGCVGGLLDVSRLNEDWLQTAFYNRMPDEIEKFAGVFPFAASANLGVTRSAFDEIGPFDDDYAPGEDLEFCLRAWRAGYPVTLARGAVINYRYRPTVPGLWRRSRDYAVAAVRISRRLEELGEARPSPWSGLRSYLWLGRHLPSLRSRRGRARWTVVAGARWGRILGSVRFRHVYL